MNQLKVRLVHVAVLWMLSCLVLLNTHIYFYQNDRVVYIPSLQLDDIFNGSVPTYSASEDSTSATNSKPLEFTSTDTGNINFIRDLVWKSNRRKEIRNADRFDLISCEVVIVVQVHNRTDYLRHLIESLRKVDGISKALLVFSHDYVSKEIYDVAASVNFCLTTQIFYPFSIQLYTNEFPGTDPGDCPKSIPKAHALSLKCLNAQHPDSYGHYREATITQAKHHWFWKMNHVFDHLDVMKHFTGPVLLLEEDNYMVKDALYVLQQMYQLKSKVCPQCAIVSLGAHEQEPSFEKSRASQVDLVQWTSNNHNMGMSMDRSTWQSIRKCAAEFCRYDDYNWDWSLQFIGRTCFETDLRVMTVRATRVFHVGKCGMHTHERNCDQSQRIAQIQALVQRNENSFFPRTLSSTNIFTTQRNRPKPNGGWGDPRDRELCLNFTKDDTHPL